MSSSNTDFGTSASVDIVVERSSLRSARDQIEDELGDVSVGVGAGGGRGLRSDGGASVASGAATAEQLDTLNSIDEHLAEIQETIERDALTQDGGGGGTTILGGLGGASAGGIGGALGTAGLVGGVVGGGILGTGILATSLANAQRSTDPIRSTTNEGRPAQAIDSALSGVLDASGIRSAAEQLDTTLGDLMSAGPVIGQEPQWLRDLTSGQFRLTEPQWLSDFTNPRLQEPQWLQSLTSPQIQEPPWVSDLQNIGQAFDIPDNVRLQLGDLGVTVDEQDVRNALETAIRAANFRQELTREITQAVQDELRGKV